MWRRPGLLGGGLTALGLLVVTVSGVILAREIARTPDRGPDPLLGVGVGVLLMVVGLTTLRDRRRFPPGYRSGAGPATAFPYTPPHPNAYGGDMPSYGGDCGSGGDSGGGGGGDGGGGGC
ncbi:hypothetical protein [Micromonospora auratinigra]|uniref:Uncharacterized protein n=1 Tax=Micromonospora auratinigra TaxID=261654 RepID=A0A1A8ZNK0_9ACTN|nr:hypothetical protein [Micromonospora auratinigra]SBT45465.1 hypothetical protein GA0070611_3043 [Micromonospora auratinigra]